MLAIQTHAPVTQPAMSQMEQSQPQGSAPIVDALARHVRSCFEMAKQDRFAITERLNDCLRRRKSEYDPKKLAAIQEQGGAEIWMRITAMKCTAAKSWLADLFSPAGDKPWALDPTPVPDLPPEIKKSLVSEAVRGAVQLNVTQQQVLALLKKHEDRLKAELYSEAEDRMGRMAEQIEDVLAESDWRRAFDEFLDDLVTYPAAILKGPVYRRKKKLKWVNMNGKSVPKMEHQIVREFRRVSPYDFFPAPGSCDPSDDWSIERLRLRPADLSAMRHAPGYNSQGIANALLQHRHGGLREWLFNDGERHRLESGTQTTNTLYRNGLIDALEFSGRLQGQMLIDWGMSPRSVPDPLEEYPVSVIVVGNHTVRALVNPDPTGSSDYYKACWRPLPGSFWGTALPEDMGDVQDVCNAAARALVNNMGIASGPQVAVDMACAVQGQDYNKFYPWKVWYYNSKGAQQASGSRAPVSFFSPNANTSQLMDVYQRFSNYADQVTGLPSYAYGSDQGSGAAKTASGLSMLMNAASKTVKGVVRNVDLNVIERAVSKLYIHMMLDPSVPDNCKGDAQVRARGSDTLMHKEAQQQRLIEMLGMTGNPVDSQIIGVEGRRNMLDEAFQSLDVSDIVPSREELQQRLAQEQQRAMQSIRQPVEPGAVPPADAGAQPA